MTEPPEDREQRALPTGVIAPRQPIRPGSRRRLLR